MSDLKYIEKNQRGMIIYKIIYSGFLNRAKGAANG